MSSNDRSAPQNDPRSLTAALEDIGKVTIVLTALILLVLTEAAIVQHKWHGLFGVPTPPPLLPLEPDAWSTAPPGTKAPPPCTPAEAPPSRSGTRRAAASSFTRLLSHVGPMAAMRAAFTRTVPSVVLPATSA